MVYMCRGGFKNGDLRSDRSLKMVGFRSDPSFNYGGFWIQRNIFFLMEIFCFRPSRKREMGFYERLRQKNVWGG